MTAPVPSGRGARRVRSPRRRSPLRRVASLVGVLVLAAVTFVLAFGGGLLKAPFPSDASTPASGVARVLAANGDEFAKIKPPVARVPLERFDQISGAMVDSIVAAEDKSFFSHGGVDPLAIVRAARNDLVGGETQGGSTITQQYVKNVYTGNQRTALRKVKEAALAVRLDNAKSKQEILRLYLNSVFFGNNTVGIQAAAKFYFDTDAKDLSYGQASMLAGIVSAPSVNNPVASFDRARIRQKYVLDRMVDDTFLTPEQATAAYNSISKKSIAHTYAGVPRSEFPEYADLVTAQIRRNYGDDFVASGNAVVKTPLDVDLEKAAKQAIADVLPDDSDPEAAVVAVNPQNGDLLALATKQDGGYRRFGFDLATDIRRNSGSTIKPFTLAAALEAKKITLSEGRYGPPQLNLSAPGCGKPATVKNAEDGEGGYFSYRSALAQSVNTVYAPLAVDVGLTKVRDLAAKAGIPTVFGSDGTFVRGFDGQAAGKGRCPVFPSQSLGAAVAPADLATAYATLVNGGVHQDRRVVSEVLQGGTGENADGGTVLLPANPRPAGQRAMSKAVADQVRDAMRDVVTVGTARREIGDLPDQFDDLVGKTGTTDDFTNAWFVGCRPTLCLAVWMGYDKEYVDGQPHSMRRGDVGPVLGGTLPTRIFMAAYTHYEENLATSKRPPLAPGATASPSPGSGGGGGSGSGDTGGSLVRQPPAVVRPTAAPATPSARRPRASAAASRVPSRVSATTSPPRTAAPQAPPASPAPPAVTPPPPVTPGPTPAPSP